MPVVATSEPTAVNVHEFPELAPLFIGCPLGLILGRVGDLGAAYLCCMSSGAVSGLILSHAHNLHYAVIVSGGFRYFRFRHFSHTVLFSAAFWSHGSQHSHSHIRPFGRSLCTSGPQ